MARTAGRGTILLVAHSYSFPAEPPPATWRPRGMAKYLSRLGYQVIVLASSAGDTAPCAPGVEVIGARDLLGSGLNWRRDPAIAPGRTAADYRESPSLLSRVLVPDLALATWLPFALPAALRLARRRRLDCVLSSSPPESMLLIGAALRRRGIPWVADLRDGWRFESYREWPTRPQRALDAWLERRVLPRADRITAVTEPITADLRARLGLDAVTITNGYDPESPAAAPGGKRYLDPTRHSLVYTGRLTPAHDALRALVVALRLLIDDSPETAAKLEVVLAGPLTREESELVEDPTVSRLIRRVGVLPHEMSLRLQREADSLLLMAADNRPSVATGKLFEYLSAEGRILVLGEDSQAAQIADEAGVAMVAPVSDPGRIKAALTDLIDDRAEPIDTDALARARDRYAYPRLVERMAEVIEEARGGPPASSAVEPSSLARAPSG